MRSIVVPQTIASDTAQKTNWKKNFAGTAALENSIAGNSRRVGRAEEGALGAGEPARAAEGEREADGPVADRRDREVREDLGHDRAGVLHPREADLEEEEADLHEHDEHRGDDDPGGLDRRDGVR